MNEYPLVSVVVPVYNGEQHIRQCVESILAQTLDDFELICVNDGSTDSTLAILEELALSDARLRIISQENKGEGAARNTGLAVAKGYYLSFFDADDFTEPQLLKQAAARAQQTDADIVVYRVDSYNNETGEKLPIPWSLETHWFPRTILSSEENPDRIFYAFQNWTWNKLFRADFIKESDLHFHEVQRSADLYFVCCALAKAQRIAILDEILYHYRVNNPTSNIATNERAPLDFYLSFLEVKNYLVKHNLYEPLKRGFQNWVAESVFFNFASLKTRSAFEELRHEMQERGCALLDLDKLREEDCFNPSIYEQLQRLLHDDTDEFLFSQLRATSRRADENVNEMLRMRKNLAEVYASKTYRVGNVLLTPLKKVLKR